MDANTARAIHEETSSVGAPDKVSDGGRYQALRLSNISKYYSGVAALEKVSVNFAAGEVHAILGENGAGKSTLMNIISGAVKPDQGVIEIGGQRHKQLTPDAATDAGIAISFQHPAVLDDLSVLENLRVAMPERIFAGASERKVGQQILDSVNLGIGLDTRGEALTIAQKHLLEIAKALALEPKILILDEPTASLGQDETEMLFARVRQAVSERTAVIYITHRMAELRQIAHRVTVLRDGQVTGEALVDEVSDDALLNMIVGRQMGTGFPEKSAVADAAFNLSVESISGEGFSDVSFESRRGEIVGVAGVAGNGQTQLMRALAGLQPLKGAIHLNGRNLKGASLLEKAAFMPSDRHMEGLAGGLTIRENAALAALGRFQSRGLISRNRELSDVRSTFESLAVKAPSIEAPVASLSGGNQQKVVMSRALLSEPAIIVADEPTQGVDVGARAEIYRILREVSESGTPVVVNSSDAAELEGLCDRVLVMSRGRVVASLTGDEVTESRIVGAAVTANTGFADPDEGRRRRHDSRPRLGARLRHAALSDWAPAVPLSLVIVLLGLYVFSQNSHYLSAFNIANILTLASALGFISLGQTVALLMAGIDLSVGPLAGFVVVVASFFINNGKPPEMIAAGFGLMFAVAFLVGVVNGCLIRFGKFTAIAATLAMYIGLQGCSFLLRDGPGGYINANVTGALTWQVGPVPVAFIVLVLVTLTAEYVLRRRLRGLRLRATGSNEESARRVGVPIDRTFVFGYIATSLFTALGAVMLMAQIGVGDPQQGVNYTLSSITAVVLGGTSLRGGRGSFIATLLGALLLTEVLNAVSFLGLSQTYQYAFQGALILIAAFLYSTLRGRLAES